MGLFKKRTNEPGEIERLKSEIASMSERLNAADHEKHQLDSTVQGIVQRLDTPMTDPPEPPEPATTIDPAEIDKLNAKLDRLATRLDDVDTRITSISTELANQISEISGDIEAMGGKEPPTDEIIDEMRDAQTRLANEQARYQIAFRKDLAEFADRLKRS